MISVLTTALLALAPGAILALQPQAIATNGNYGLCSGERDTYRGFRELAITPSKNGC